MLGAAAASTVAQIRIVIDDTEQTANRYHRGRHRRGIQNQTAVSSPTLLTPSSPPASFWGFGFGNGDHYLGPDGGEEEEQEDDSSYVVDYELDEMHDDDDGLDEDSELDEQKFHRRDHHQRRINDEYGGADGEEDELELDDEEDFYNRFATVLGKDTLLLVWQLGLMCAWGCLVHVLDSSSRSMFASNN